MSLEQKIRRKIIELQAAYNVARIQQNRQKCDILFIKINTLQDVLKD